MATAIAIRSYTHASRFAFLILLLDVSRQHVSVVHDSMVLMRPLAVWMTPPTGGRAG